MLSSTIERVGTRVARVVADTGGRHGVSRAIDRDENLVDGGFTSMALVELMLAMEVEFDTTIPPRDLTPENFGSIIAIEAIMSRLSDTMRQ